LARVTAPKAARVGLCPSETTLVEFADGTLVTDAAAELEWHVDQCSTCRRALAEMARAGGAEDDHGVSGPRRARSARAPGLFVDLSSSLLAPGEIVADRFRIERLLAQGGMGVVYVAVHVETEQRVAVKVLVTPVDAESRRTMDGFRLEARVFARIESEHIVRVLDAGIDEHRKLAFIAMELLVGETLGARVRNGGAFAPAALLSVLEQVASALTAAHRHMDDHGRPMPIVHRDLKPENIFLTMDRESNPRAKLLDFGMAKVASATATESVEVRGTPQYMAPEQLDGARVSPATDVAALGLIAFYCLAGCSYWKAASSRSPLATLVREILAGTTVPASQRARELGAQADALSPAFDAWFARCTALEPSGRFASASEAVVAFAAAFELATSDSTAGATPRGPSERVDRSSPPVGSPATTVTLALVALVATLFIVGRALRPSSADPATTVVTASTSQAFVPEPKAERPPPTTGLAPKPPSSPSDPASHPGSASPPPSSAPASARSAEPPRKHPTAPIPPSVPSSSTTTKPMAASNCNPPFTVEPNGITRHAKPECL
jgi:serine/threonine-protein kinase